MKKTTVTTVLLANDQPVLSETMRALLVAQSDIRIVGEAASGAAAVEDAQRLKPDVVLMDLALPDSNGIAAAGQIRRNCPATQVVILSDKANEEYIFRALNAGALGYVLKEPDGQETMDAIRAARSGRRYLSPRIADIVVGNFVRLRQAAPAPDPLASLSTREREVLHLVVGGRSSKEIAARLHLAPSTVDTYRSRIMEKLGVHSVAALVKFALKYDLAAGADSAAARSDSSTPSV